MKRFPYYRDPGEPLLFAEMVTEDTLDRFKVRRGTLRASAVRWGLVAALKLPGCPLQADKEPVAGKRPAHGSDSDGEDAAAGGDGQEKPRKKAKRARKGKRCVTAYPARAAGSDAAVQATPPRTTLLRRQRMEMKAKREAAKKGS